MTAVTGCGDLPHMNARPVLFAGRQIERTTVNRRKLTTMSALLLAGAMTLGACGARGGDEGGGDREAQTPEELKAYEPGQFDAPDAGDPQDGGTLTYADFAEPRTLDPSQVIATGASGGSALVAVYDQLVRYNAKTKEYEPHLAQSVEPNDDHTVWTVTLREGVKFTDGTPLNADAVVGSVNRYIEMRGYDMSIIGALWKGVKKVDDLTVEFELTSSWTTFDAMLGQGLGFIAAPAAYADPDNFKPIGAGAFTFESYKPQEELVLAANPDYWDGKPHLAKLRFVWLGSDQTKRESFEGGQVQAMYVRDPRIVSELRGKDQPGVVQLDGLGNLIQFNEAEGMAGSYPKVRKAIAIALNPEQVYDRAFQGHGLPTKNIFSAVSQWYPGEELVSSDLDEAKKLVEEAKSEGWDGTLEITTVNDPSARDQGLVVQGQLEAVGIDVTLDVSPSVTDLTNKVFVERKYESARIGSSFDESDPYQRLYVMYHSQSVARTSPSDPEMDALIDQLRETPKDGRKDAILEIEKKFADYNPSVGLGSTANFMTWNDTVHGALGTNQTMMAFEKAWIAQE